MTATTIETFLQVFDPFIPLVAALIGTYVMYTVQKQNPISGGLVLGELYSLFTGTPSNKQFLISFRKLTSQNVIMLSGLLVAIEAGIVFEEPTYGSIVVLAAFSLYIFIDNILRKKIFGNSTHDAYLPYILNSEKPFSKKHKYFLYSSAILINFSIINLFGFIVFGGLANFFPNPLFQSYQTGVVSTIMLFIGILSNLSRGYTDFDWINHTNITSEILKVRKVDATVFFNDKHNDINSHVIGEVLSIWPKLIIEYKRRGVHWRERIQLSQVVRIAFHMEPKPLNVSATLVGEMQANITTSNEEMT